MHTYVDASSEVPSAMASSFLLPRVPPRTYEDIETQARHAVAVLCDTVEQLKDVRGTGQETAGRGDPRIPQRREALHALLCAQKTSAAPFLTLPPLTDTLAQDAEFLHATEEHSYNPHEPETQFTWSRCDMSASYQLGMEFKTRLQNGTQRAHSFETHEKTFFQADDGSMWGVHEVKDPHTQEEAMLDVLMQLRNTYNPTTPKPSWPNDRNRLDRAGPVLVAEQRLLLEHTPHNTSLHAQKMYALLRQSILSHPISSCNTVFAARNAVASWYMDNQTSDWTAQTTSPTRWVKYEKPPTAQETAYETIHHNFSCESPRNIAALIQQWVFPLGPIEKRGMLFVSLVNALEQARAGHVEQAMENTALLCQDNPLAEWDVFKTDPRFQDTSTWADALKDFLLKTCQKPMGEKAERNLCLARDVYNSICRQAPTADSLEKAMFYAGQAWPSVSACVIALQKGSLEDILHTLTHARKRVRQEIQRCTTGYQKHLFLMVDGQLSRLMYEHLGKAVSFCEKMQTLQQCSLGLLAIKTCLHDIITSSLHCVQSPNDPHASPPKHIERLALEWDHAFEKGRVTPKQFQQFMQQSHKAITDVIRNMRFFTDERASAMSDGNITTDPEFLDQWVKESALHYATALASTGMRVGLRETRSSESMANIQGMRVLNSVGPVVFPHVVFANNMSELLSLKPPRDALCVVQQMAEKKMVSVAGVIVDAASAPGGNSHMNMYAMNNGMTVLALPELNKDFMDFLKHIASKQGVFINDNNGSIEICSVEHALDTGLLKKHTLEKYKPGFNKNIHYMGFNETTSTSEETAQHHVFTSPHRTQRNIVLYCPEEHIRGVGKTSLSFEELATLGLAGRHLSGEKGLVLALLSKDPLLKTAIPQGSVVTTGRIITLLREAGVLDTWNAPFTNDPLVGILTDDNFLRSAFYTQPTYRSETIRAIRTTVYEALQRFLIADNTTLTPQGELLYQELYKNPALAASHTWIARSSFTGEDRPGKSGAGQYESYPHLTTPVERIQGIVKVLCSGWLDEPIENNILEEINLQHIMPAVVVQECLQADFSGVAVSRGENNRRGHVTLQCVKGFGGGVDGCHAEEGVINQENYSLRICYPGHTEPLIEDPKTLQNIRTVVLHIEKIFHTLIEKGKGYAVDVEYVFTKNELKIVQARVLMAFSS